jgi:hypothetical protein
MGDNATAEIALREALLASSKVYRQRVSGMDARVGREDDDDILGAGHTHHSDGGFVETWEARKRRRAAEAAAAKAAEQPNQQLVPRNVTTTLISREAAIAAGQTRYFTGEKCSHGHIAERIVSTRTCVVCHREHQNNNKTMRGREARRQARAVGKTRYFTAQKCPRGHVSERLVSTGRCVACHNEDVRKQRRQVSGKLCPGQPNKQQIDGLSDKNVLAS